MTIAHYDFTDQPFSEDCAIHLDNANGEPGAFILRAQRGDPDGGTVVKPWRPFGDKAGAFFAIGSIALGSAGLVYGSYLLSNLIPYAGQ